MSLEESLRRRPGSSAGRRRLWRVLGLAVGLAGLAAFARMCVAADLGAGLATLPPALLLLVPVAGAAHALGTLSWARCFPRAGGSSPAGRPRFGSLFSIRLAGEAVNNALFSAYVAGEPIKGVLAARHGVAATDAFASVVIGKTSFVLGELVFVGACLGVAAVLFGSQAPLAGLQAWAVVAGVAIVAAGVYVQRRGFLHRSGKLLQALHLGARSFWERVLPRAGSVDEAVRAFYERRRGDFALSVLLAAAGWLAGAIELWVFLDVLDAERPLAMAVVLEGAILVVKGLSFFVPGSIGVQEGSIAWLFQATGLGTEAGVAYAVLRRFRELVWIGLGFLLLGAHLRRA